jgi:ribosomal protein S27AE
MSVVDYQKRTCDRCGTNADELKNISKGWAQVIVVEIDNPMRKTHDLCPECRDEIINWLAEG